MYKTSEPAPAAGWDQGPALHDEARRIMQICNACRYCEGYCAVFPAMTRRRMFSDADLSYLANLCHNCKGCYYACQYAAPHEFDVNVPKTMAELRAWSWHAHAWPGVLQRAFRYNAGLIVFLGVIFTAGFLMLAGLMHDAEAMFRAQPGGDFFALLPHGMMVWTAGPVFVLALLAMAVSVLRFYRQGGGAGPGGAAASRAVMDALSLKNLGGGGHGCNNHNEEFSMLRRNLHHAVFYGFMLCFAATGVGTIYHYVFGWHAPYGWMSLPVWLGMSGGVLLSAGTAGLYLVRRRAEPAVSAAWLNGMETAFIGLLFFTGLSGILLTLLRETALMGTLLVLHLGAVLTLFAVLPYSKMVHGLYRLAALVRFHLEGAGKD